MHRFSVRAFCLQLAFLLFVLCLAVYSVIGTVVSSFHLSFIETAARTDLVLSVFSCLLAVAISLFIAYTAHRRRKNQMS
jgi:ABC-type Fe3+ transport system permease subunit